VAGQDDFEDCTIIQMDIAGFTQMASELEPVELIDILNVFFMHIDQVRDSVSL
jgi:class 3 adenylate cyclase